MSLGVNQSSRDHSNPLNTFQISYILYLSDYRDLKINDWYVYPNWAYVLGWMMTFSSAITVPLWVIIHLCSTKGSLREVRVHLDHQSHRWTCLDGLLWLCWFQRLAVGCRAVEDPRWKKTPEELDGANVELMASAVKAWTMWSPWRLGATQITVSWPVTCCPLWITPQFAWPVLVAPCFSPASSCGLSLWSSWGLLFIPSNVWAAHYQGTDTLTRARGQTSFADNNYWCYVNFANNCTQ